MNPKLIFCSYALFTLLSSDRTFSQTAAAPVAHANPQYSVQGTVASAAASPQGAVSYSSVTELNGLLAQLEDTSKTTQVDLAKLRIERWKTDSGSKKRSLNDADSVQRNLENALPEMITQLRNSPENVPATFKLYRNLDALYDVLGSVVESAGAFGSRDDFQSLSNDLSSFEGTRKQIAQRLETLATAKEQEIVRLRTDLKAAQAAAPAATAPAKKVVVDDNEAAKPAVKKKPPAKKPATTPPAAKPAATTPGQTAPPPQSKPQ